MPLKNKPVNIELGNHKKYQLYNLKEDIGQTNNLATSNPEKLEEMIKAFNAIKGDSDNEVEALELH